MLIDFFRPYPAKRVPGGGIAVALRCEGPPIPASTVRGAACVAGRHPETVKVLNFSLENTYI